MSVIRSLELVSRARDRELYPNPADFTVKVNQSISSNIAMAINPTTRSYPIKGFSGAEFVTAGFFGNISGPGTPAAPYLSSRAKPSSGYYNGMVLEQLNYTPPANDGTTRVIFSGLGSAAAANAEEGNSVIPIASVSGVNLRLTNNRQICTGALNAPIPWVTPINTAAAPARPLSGNYVIEISRPGFLNQLPGAGSTQTGACDWFIVSDPQALAAGLLEINEGLTPVTTSVFGNTTLATTVTNFNYMSNVMTITGVSGPIIRNVLDNGAGALALGTLMSTSLSIIPTPAVNPTTTVFTLVGGPRWITGQTPVVNDFVVIRCVLGNGEFCGGTFLVTAITNPTSFTISGVLRENTGAAITKTIPAAIGDTVITSISVKNVRQEDLIYNGTGQNVYRDLGTNILKFIGFTPVTTAPTAATPYADATYLDNATFQAAGGGYNAANVMLINSPADQTHGATPLTVFTAGQYTTDSSNYVSFHDTAYLILDSLTTSPDGTLQNNFTTYDDSISIESVDQETIGWVQNTNIGSNYSFLIHKPPAINFTRCLDPNEKYSGITITNPYGGQGGVGGVQMKYHPANITALTANTIIETYNRGPFGYFANVLTQAAVGANIPVPEATVNMSLVPVQSTPGYSFLNTIRLPTPNIAGADAQYTFPRGEPIGLTFTTGRLFSMYTVSNGIALNSSPISDYNGNTGLATLQTPFNTGNWSPPNTMWKINNDATILNANTILIQNGTDTANAYANYYIDNLDHIPRNRGNLIEILSYDSVTKVATLASPIISATTAQEFYIRRDLPAVTSTTPGSVILTNVPTNAIVQTAGTGYALNTQYTNNATPELVTFAINVTEIDANGGIVRFTILYALGNQPNGTNITMLGGGGNAVLTVSAAGQAIDVSVLTSPPTSTTVGSFVFLSRGLLTNATGPVTAVSPAIPCTSTNRSHYTGIVVADYNAANVTALVNNSNLTHLVVTRENIIPNALSPAAVVSGSTSFSGILEFLGFSGDTTNSLIFNASTITSAAQDCYQISLLDLILPNQVLDNEFGGIIAFYPYVYVELQNISGAMGPNHDVIISNNINSRPAVFRATISDTTSPTVSKFIKLSGSNSVSVMKFTPRDNLRFRVFFGNGETFKTLADDTIPPLRPDFDLQISALFSIQKLK